MQELKEIVAEASRRLARLDDAAHRLDELAVSRGALHRDLSSLDADQSPEQPARHARRAAPDMAVLKGMLAVKRANPNVMRRLREMHERRLDCCSGRQVRGGSEPGTADKDY